jgi:hypothetical protein
MSTQEIARHAGDKKRHTGEVRIRSNVCLDSNDWHLVPGDLVKACGMNLRDLTKKQRDEMMYYERCCICHRTVFELMEEGCDYCATGRHGVPSVAEAKQRRTRRYQQQELG